MADKSGQPKVHKILKERPRADVTAPTKKEGGKWRGFLTFLSMGGWILIVVVVVGLALGIGILLK